MKVRTRRKLLISSVAMLLVALLALGTATFAWFTSFTTVYTNTLKVNAVGDQSLLIKGTQDGNKFSQKGTSTLSEGADTLHPATSYDGENFGKLGSDVVVAAGNNAAATWTGTGGVFQASDLSLIDESNEFKNYVATTTYYLKNVGKNANVYVEGIALGGTDAELLPSLRVAIKLGDGEFKVFNAGGGTNMGDKVGKYNTTTSKWDLAEPTYATVGATAGNGATSLGTLSTNDAKLVSVRIWIEGQDTACMSDKINVNKLMGLQIYFTTAPHEANNLPEVDMSETTTAPATTTP